MVNGLTKEVSDDPKNENVWYDEIRDVKRSMNDNLGSDKKSFVEKKQIMELKLI